MTSKYVLERPLAQGGMGSLWVARHVELDVPVAIKFSALERSPAHDARFRREARATARLRSPHVVHVYDYGIDRDEPYIAMELLEGKNLKDLLDEQGRLPLGRTAALVAQVARGLRVAHEAGIVHRDLKPSNLFLTRVGDEDVLKILDFGIAKASADLPGELASGERVLSADATRLGAIVGSPGYMSPEQARGEPVDARSDLWSLAVVVFRMLTGVEPFPGSDATETANNVCSAPLPKSSLLAPDLPPVLDAFFARALARPKEERFQSAQELSDALSAIAARHPDPALERLLSTDDVAGVSRESGPAGRTGETRPIAIDAARPAEPLAGRRARSARGLVALVVALAVGLGVAHWWRGEPRPAAGLEAFEVTAERGAEAPSSSHGAGRLPAALPRASEASPASERAPSAKPAASESAPAANAVSSAHPAPSRGRARARRPAPAAASARLLPGAREIDPIFGLPK